MKGFNNYTIAGFSVAVGAAAAVFLGPVVGWLGQALFNGLTVGLAAWLALQWAKERAGR